MLPSRKKQNSEKRFPKAECHITGSTGNYTAFRTLPLRGSDTHAVKKSVDERLIVFQAPVIGYDTTLPMWLGRRYTVKVFQSLSNCTMLCSKAVSLSALQKRALRQKDRIRAIYKSCSLNRTRHM